MKNMSVSSLTISRRAALEIVDRWNDIIVMDIEHLEAWRVKSDISWMAWIASGNPFRMVDESSDAAAFRDVRKRQRDVLENVLAEMRRMRTDGDSDGDGDVAISDLSALRFLVFGNQDPENMLFPFDLSGTVEQER